MPTYALYAVTLVFTGFAVVTILSTANGYVQATTDAHMRGRVLAIYIAILLGGTPVGAPIVGWVADELGPRAAIQLGTLAALIAAAIAITWLVWSGRLHRGGRLRLRLDETRPLRIVTQPIAHTPSPR